MSGVALAVVLGVGLGFLARPKLAIDQPPAAAPAAPTAALAPPGAAQAPLSIIQGPAQVAAAPQPRGKLETLPPEMAAAERAPVRPAAAGEAAQTASATAPEPPADDTQSQTAATPPAETAPQAAAPPPERQASFDCATARPGAEQLVCSDPELSADDRRLAHAYRRALRAGVDPGDLRQEQRDWYAIREDAARHSRRALVQVYDQRIGELNQMADHAPPGAGGPDDDGGYGQ